VQIRQLSIAGAYEVTPVLRTDDRGTFLEWYRFDVLETAIGHALDLRQANTSVSRRGVVRGIHFADIPRGQAKYITVARGSILDFVVDIRVGSPTYGQWESAVLDDRQHRALYLSEGLGHLFVALEDDTTVSYLVSDVYTPAAEHGINPFDPELALEFPGDLGELIVSDKDRDAPSLAELAAAGTLPTLEAANAYYVQLNEARR
jgi:dTDP-4-dehydrorhamnose 3,5-epimerase